MRLSEFDYYLPPGLIAQHPAKKREQARLLVLNRKEERIEHKLFVEILRYLNPGDLLVINDTKVLPARLTGRKETGGKVTLLLLSKINGSGPSPGGEEVWQCLIQAAKLSIAGQKIYIAEEMEAEVLRPLEQGSWEVRLRFQGELRQILHRIGTPPLPPYIKRKTDDWREQDQEYYQTIYAKSEGAAAAPTAGLHFSAELLKCIEEAGVVILPLTLHVGWGSFLPLRSELVEEHKMPPEYYSISETVAERVSRAKADGGRVIAVGTTTTRALEQAANGEEGIVPGKGEARIFIYPGYRFKIVDALITNFHLPRSTHLILVSAFTGRELILRAYQEAIVRDYRFLSYGDGTMIL